VQGATAWYMAEDAIRLHPGQHVLVQAAAGGVGLILVQLAKQNGCVVYGTASSDSKLEFLRSIGVDHPINYAKEDFADAIRRIRGPDLGLDVIYDSLGGSYFSKGMKLLAPGGRLLAFGGAAGSSEKGDILKTLKLATGFGIFSPIPWLMSSKGFLGINMLKIGVHSPATLRRCLDGIIGRWKSGKLKLHSGGVYPAAKLGDAHRALGSRGTIGKLVIEW
ncbi:MAG: zinc-binding dehydrogenase, partial [Bdellovibrionota bacterium]